MTGPRRPSRTATGRLALLLALGLVSLGARATDVSRGDALWAARAEGAEGPRARPGPILEAVRAYEGALALDPDSPEARWKLLRAIHFAGEFAARDEEEARLRFEEGVAIAERGLDRLADRVGAGERLDALEPERVPERLAEGGLPARDVGRLHFWAALHWGAWARSVGLLGAVREGVANRMDRYTAVALALDPGYDDGAALRLRGRLHAELPRVPILSGWVDPARALPLVERAYDLAPENPGNRLLLALTILERAPGRRPEAISLLERVGRLEPRASMRVEDVAMREAAREELRAARSKAP